MAQESPSVSLSEDPTVSYMLPGLSKKAAGTRAARQESQRRSQRAGHDQGMLRCHPVKLESKQISSHEKDSASCAPNMLYSAPMDCNFAATTLLQLANTEQHAGPVTNTNQATECPFNDDPTPQPTADAYNTMDGTSATLIDILTELRCLRFQVHTMQQTLSHMGLAADWSYWCSPSGNFDATYPMV